MADYILPVDASEPAYTVDVDLGDTLYRLGITWNTRGEFWTLDLMEADDTPIVMGVRIVPDWDLLGRFTDARLPAGRIYCVDQSGAGLPPTYTDLGERVVLAYVDGN